MNWFIYSVIALLMWSGSDLFSKIGCRDQNDKTNFLKMTGFVGLAMGLHALYEIFINGVSINFDVILRYLPVSAFYISSMIIGYLNLRFIELSISSPISNSSGAIVCILSLIVFGTDGISPAELFATFLVCAGVTALGFIEFNENPVSREERQKKSGFTYKKSFVALMLPILYCLLDAGGTFFDALILESGLDEASANVAYELTFFVCGMVSFAICLSKKGSFSKKSDSPKIIASIMETAGQFFYIFAISDTSHVAQSVPIISSYCLLSVLWSRIFLKEKLSAKHYFAILFTAIGIVILGFFE